MKGHILDGGYTIKKYSSNEPERGLVAIQIEVIRSIRADDNRREKFAADMADCIYTYVRPFV
jgi:hypothetical protein